MVKRLADLEKQNAENQKIIKMLYDVADKGRVFSWENKQNDGVQGQKVKLSVIDGKVLVGWRTVRDELVTDPRTGRTIGESQQYELLLLDKEGQHSTRAIDGYLNFSNLRYENRIECHVLGKSESMGRVTFTLGLPDGKEIQLDSKFVN